MRVAIVGCGYVASSYIRTLPNHPKLQLAGIFDRDADRRGLFAKFYGLHQYPSLDGLIEDRTVDLVVNLTNPTSHYSVSMLALKAGKHVYSEKPLAMTLAEAQDLVETAKNRHLLLASAPCNVLGETAQTMWKALREGRIGTPRLAYAELDDGILFEPYRNWANELGIPWPFEDEFRTGGTLEHAAYYLGWLTALFGPAKRIVSFSGVQPDSSVIGVDYDVPAFHLACIRFSSGLVARITCSVYTTNDHTLRIFGDAGILSTTHSWDYASPVFLRRRPPVSWTEKHPRRAKILRVRPTIPLVRPATFAYDRAALRMDFSRGIADLADAAERQSEPRLSAAWSLHVTELALAMNAGDGIEHEVQTTFDPMEPMPWAR